MYKNNNAMKTIILLTTFVVIAVWSVSCSKDDDQVQVYQFKHVRFQLKANIGTIVYAEYVNSEDSANSRIFINDEFVGMSYKDTSAYFISEYEYINIRFKTNDGKKYISEDFHVEYDSIMLKIYDPIKY
jgi:hypothetical protein